jgi:hypothetical protein
MNSVASIWCQITPGQDGDGMARHQDYAIKCLREDTLAPYSPDSNTCDFFLWAYMTEKEYQPLPLNMATLKRKVRGWVGQNPQSDCTEVHHENDEEGRLHGAGKTPTMKSPHFPPSSTWWQASCPERWCLAISSPSLPSVACTSLLPYSSSELG